MTDEEMEKLASLIVDKVFERQAELDEEFLAEYHENNVLIVQQDAEPTIDELQEKLHQAERDENYELASKLKHLIDKLKNK